MSEPVLVTGSSGAIGSAVVTRLAAERRTTIGIDLLSPTTCAPVHFVHADVTTGDGLAAAEAALADEQLWAVVACAGAYPIVSLDAYSDELWNTVLDVNAGSVFRLVRALRGRIRPGGRIVVVASGASHAGSRDVGYSASKAAALGLVRGLAAELAPSGILVNAVTPGITDSAMSARMPADRRQRHVERTLLGRMAQPDEIAVAVSFLLDPANSYMTGASVDVNGGLYMR